MGPGLEGDGEHLPRRGHFQIERFFDLGSQPRDILVANMTTILPQMRGDPVGAGFDGGVGCLDGIGMVSAACVPNRGDVVDVDPEAQMRNCRQMLVPEPGWTGAGSRPARQS